MRLTGKIRSPIEAANLISQINNSLDYHQPSGINLQNERRYIILTVERSQSPSDSFIMSYVAKGDKEYDATGAPLPPTKVHKIRITLTSGNVKNLEKCAFIHHTPL